MKRSPAAAFWLSVLPGLGHLYLGQMAKGLALALLAVGLIDLVDRGADSFGILIPVYWLFVMIDAHRGAQEQNRAIEAGSPIREERLWGSAWWGWALVGLGVLFLLDNVGIRVFDWLWRFWPVILIV
ncbi:MAG: LiaI-LiaF-like domain-containing protein, partial [Acidobacteriota bacterium]